MTKNQSEIFDDHLYPRKEARAILGGISDPTLRRLEQSGALKAIKLNKTSPSAQTFYLGANLRKLIEAR
jgi:hypothetical protein